MGEVVYSEERNNGCEKMINDGVSFVGFGERRSIFVQQKPRERYNVTESINMREVTLSRSCLGFEKPFFCFGNLILLSSHACLSLMGVFFSFRCQPITFFYSFNTFFYLLIFDWMRMKVVDNRCDPLFKFVPMTQINHKETHIAMDISMI